MQQTAGDTARDRTVSTLPLRARSTCTAEVRQGQSHSQSPSCGGAEPLPVMEFLLPVWKHSEISGDIAVVSVTWLRPAGMDFFLNYLLVFKRPQVEKVNVTWQ